MAQLKVSKFWPLTTRQRAAEILLVEGHPPGSPPPHVRELLGASEDQVAHRRVHDADALQLMIPSALMARSRAGGDS